MSVNVNFIALHSAVVSTVYMHCLSIGLYLAHLFLYICEMGVKEKWVFLTISQGIVGEF